MIDFTNPWVLLGIVIVGYEILHIINHAPFFLWRYFKRKKERKTENHILGKVDGKVLSPSRRNQPPFANSPSSPPDAPIPKAQPKNTPRPKVVPKAKLETYN